MFASQALAARIDRAEGRLCAGIAAAARAALPAAGSEVFEVGGGVAVFAGPGSPTNKMVGVGFDGEPVGRELDRVERAFTERGAPLQAEVSTLADPSWHACLIGRGYHSRGFENVLGHSLITVEPAPVTTFEIRLARDAELPALADVAIAAFGNPDVGGVGGDVIPPADDLQRWFTLTMSVPGFEGFAVTLDGTLIAEGSLRLDEGIAQLCGAATLPPYRRRGVQSALVRLRLQRARDAGCDVAVVGVQPGSKSQQNVQREGFALLYARQILVKDP